MVIWRAYVKGLENNQIIYESCIQKIRGYETKNVLLIKTELCILYPLRVLK